MKRPTPAPVATSIHVVGAAILSSSRCFVAQRGEAMALPLKWEFPGGKVEDGEDPAEALVREVHEELFLEIEVGDYLGRGVVGDVTLDVYAARIVAGWLQLREHRDGRWVGVDEIDDLDWAEADVPVLARLREVLAERDGARGQDPRSELEAIVQRSSEEFEEPESLELLARLRSAGVIDDLAWLKTLGMVGQALQLLSAPTVQEDGVFSPDADPRNADWIKIVGARRLAKHVLPSWAALWLWRAGGYREEPGFWEAVEREAGGMGLAELAQGR